VIFCRQEIEFDAPVSIEAFSNLPDVRDVRVDGNVLSGCLAGRPDRLVKTAARPRPEGHIDWFQFHVARLKQQSVKSDEGGYPRERSKSAYWVTESVAAARSALRRGFGTGSLSSAGGEQSAAYLDEFVFRFNRWRSRACRAASA